MGGGAERTLINLLQLINYDLYEVTLVSVLHKGVYINSIPADVKYHCLFKNELILKILTKTHQKIDFIYPLSFVFNKKLKSSFDVGISFLDGIYTELLHSKKDIKKKIAWVHSSYKSYNNFYKFYKNKSYRKRLIEKRYKKLDTLIFVSNDALMEFKSLFGGFKSMMVIYNPVNPTSIFKKAKEEILIDFPKTSFNFVAVGSLIPVKNYELLIKAASILIKRYKDFKIFILGHGYLESKLKALITQEGLQNNFELMGFISNPYPYMLKADAFIMTSLTEALPTALCEAMILQKPVIVTNVSGCREIVNGGEFGLLCESSEYDIAAKMYQLITNTDLFEYYKKKSIERSQVFDDQLFIQKFYELILDETPPNQLHC